MNKQEEEWFNQALMFTLSTKQILEVKRRAREGNPMSYEEATILIF